MATLHQLMAALQSQVEIATGSVTIFDAPVVVQTGLGWPPVNTIQQVVKVRPPSALISIFDRKSSHDSTRWLPSAVALTAIQTQLVSAPTQQLLPPGGSVSITISGSVTAGDAVSLVLLNRSVMSTDAGDGSNVTPTQAVVASLRPTDTLVTAAAALAAAVAADPSGTGLLVSVASLGPVVTVTNVSGTILTVSTYTGNGGSVLTEIARRRRELQITVWAPTNGVRDAVSDPIEELIAQIEVFRGQSGEYASGLMLPDGTSARVTSVNGYLVDDAVLSDMYRREFIIAADYSITAMDSLYSVLVPVNAYSFTA